MIVAPQRPQRSFASAWVAGITLAMLLVGLQGAVQPLLPKPEGTLAKPDPGDEIPLAPFIPPASDDSRVSEPPAVEPPDLEIPPLPAIQTPLKPPEMVELTPLEDPPPPVPMRTPPPKPEPKKEAKPTPSTGTPARTSGSGSATLFTGGGGGRFPSPNYPAQARANKVQGTVRLLVTVEANGVPSSVTVQSSSGSEALDTAARDQVSRRWRWPAGELRRYVVPVRFEIQP